MAKKNRQDSRTVKIITMVAMLYLPASLVSSLFSTNLVRVEPSNVSVGKAMWVYVITTVVLTVCTVAGAYVWNWQSSKEDNMPAKGAA